MFLQLRFRVIKHMLANQTNGDRERHDDEYTTDYRNGLKVILQCIFDSFNHENGKEDDDH